ncbi:MULTISPECIES: ABC transporter substrate-binding protein [unclassified Mesorhizobium]|uniref:ABC transporter substrate-binding protein n=1 Tax=unclassified Mesorhizobium TaxID=325217 RepID=UPI0003CE0A84|nr:MULTISPECIES: ABC transporter substrate-binding protein [unclassified Mesorhizobium]ESW68139.1 iron ABC transporter substrate-binding protein [Mesorhizobium sp. LSJC277A00]ESX13832.1 hypothetical protein X766_28670 [Mesorhizobium sp. LSJC255A00]ESX25050.1 iron ABC transporter substrate-binding protein [Mesorhizobium sp. LSJC264A00]ESX60088.1 iron ABC transporter substrate-binding protein [Mesorhizobium sp. LSHC422A00]ESZ11443.1 hypothetical protein X735_25670 [Mesorhizobium sp. L2C085B000]
MKNRLATMTAVLSLSAAFATLAPAAEIPAGYPDNYKDLVAAATAEGHLSIYSTTDAALVQPLLKDFEAAFPGIAVEYSDLNSTELYNRVIAETASGQGTADVAWSSAPDLQIKLAADGYAQEYKSVEAAHVPAWASYKGMIYGATADPVTFVYNKRLVPEGDVPASHADLLKLMTGKTADYDGKIASYDPEKSGVGFYFYNQDAKTWTDSWALNKAFGKAHIKLYSSAGSMIEKVTSGEHSIAYGIFGSYGLAKQAKDENLGVIIPKDYVLVTTRATVIPAEAKDPNAAKLFVDYLLSARAQKLIANDIKLYAVRDDVEGATTLASIKAAAGENVHPIALDDKLLEGLDETTRLAFLNEWQKAMKGE